MEFLNGLILVLGVMLLVLLWYLMSLKREMRKVREELARTKEMSYNRQLTIPLFDRDFTGLTTELNRNLDYQKQLKLQYEHSEQQMKQSISNIAHDLRTPLTVIKGNLQMMEKDGQMTQKSREYLRISLDKTDTLKDMVDDFFELSVLESDRSKVELQAVPITNVLMQFVLEHETVIREHGLTPDIHFPEKSVYILADPAMLDRMLGNLLHNVLKYARDEFRISAECRDSEQYCEIAFANKADMQEELAVERLFDRSYQADKSRKASGAGLGLYIVKLLAEKQGASVGAQWSGGQLVLKLCFATCRESG
ncbi:MAG: HAMP domain-containing histidine kinase [Lachnospiraceae bacterium]|nr:HAMP domain-containing histidine kinase [Lachnospiraceae bacterium]